MAKITLQLRRYKWSEYKGNDVAMPLPDAIRFHKVAKEQRITLYLQPKAKDYQEMTLD